jgi:hypothetical protein
MPARFVCLANSYKEGGRCVAGIMLDHNNNPIIQGGLPIWIRPISDEGHGEIRQDLVDHIRILDIVEIEIVDYVRDGYQSENATFRESSIGMVGAFDPGRLYELCDERPLLFGNHGKVINIKYIDRLHHSLALVRATDFKVIEYSTEDDPGRKKIRLSFTYKGVQYDFPITDPVFKQNYQANANLVDDINEMLLTLSVGVPLNDWHYKLVAGVIVM